MASAVLDTKKQKPRWPGCYHKKAAIGRKYKRWKSIRKKSKEQGQEKILAENLCKCEKAAFVILKTTQARQLEKTNECIE